MPDLNSDVDAQAVLHMMTVVGIPLASFVEKVTAVQHRPQAIGFDFDCKDSFSLMKILESNRNFRADDATSWVGAEASSNARKSGYGVSYRQISDSGSLHVQIGLRRCNVHFDTVSITTTRIVGTGALYDYDRLFAHWINDLLPEMKGHSITTFLNAHLYIDASGGRNEDGVTEYRVTAGFKKRF
jgi:hypothetical protein